MDLVQILLTFGVPSAITGLAIWLFKKWLDGKETKREEREKNTEQLMIMIMATARANTVLAEATARAVQRIPDAKCNGDMTAALEKARQIQTEEKDFLINQGIKHIFE